MTAAEIIAWIVSPAALAAFVLSFTFMMLSLDAKERLLIKNGVRDTEILEASEKASLKKGRPGRIIAMVVEVMLFLLFGILIFTAIYSAAFSNNFPLFGVQLKVVGSASMATVHPDNEYYIESRGLTNQFAFDDVIIIYSLPAEEDIKQFDVITYYNASEKHLVVHRIVAIEDTGSGKLYTMRGDANNNNDKKKISYSDMRGIYSGKRIRGLGAIIRFAQSGFGLIAIGTCLYVCIFDEVMRSRLKKADKARLDEILSNQTSDGGHDDEPPPNPQIAQDISGYPDNENREMSESAQINVSHEDAGSIVSQYTPPKADTNTKKHSKPQAVKYRESDSRSEPEPAEAKSKKRQESGEQRDETNLPVE